MCVVVCVCVCVRVCVRMCALRICACACSLDTRHARFSAAACCCCCCCFVQAELIKRDEILDALKEAGVKSAKAISLRGKIRSAMESEASAAQGMGNLDDQIASLVVGPAACTAGKRGRWRTAGKHGRWRGARRHGHVATAGGACRGACTGARGYNGPASPQTAQPVAYGAQGFDANAMGVPSHQDNSRDAYRQNSRGHAGRASTGNLFLGGESRRSASQVRVLMLRYVGICPCAAARRALLVYASHR